MKKVFRYQFKNITAYLIKFLKIDIFKHFGVTDRFEDVLKEFINI